MKQIIKAALLALILSPPMAASAGNGAAISISAGDSYTIQKMAMAEAEGEGESGKAQVMNVIINRLESPEFPDNVNDVLMQPGAFASVGNGRYDVAVPDAECIDAMEAIQTQGLDESQGALYFESVDNTDTWHKENLEFIFQQGNHLFYK